MSSPRQPTPDFSFWKHEGGSGLATLVTAPWTPGGVGATTVATVDTILGVPFPVGRRKRFDQINFEVTTAGGAGSVARAGIYRATSDDNIHPGALMVDGGEFSTTSTGQKTAVISVVLDVGLYWLVLLAGVAAPTIRAITAVQMHAILGSATPGTVLAQHRIEAAQAYGALPATFPSGTLQVNPAPFVQLRPAA